MNLLVRINLVLVPVLAAAAAATGWECAAVLQADARQEALNRAGLMMDGALAARAYTTEEIVPLLQAGMSREFLPQSVPSYAATQHFLKLRARHPEYSYKEATLNPTNPRDRATDWEADLVEQFRNDPAATEIVGERDTPMGPSLYRARPIRADPPCLPCHSLPSAAPATLIARYGSNNGFGWQVHEVVAAQIVSVPLANAAAGEHATLRSVMVSIALVAAAALLAVNAALYFVCVRPLRRILAVAEELSLGNTPAAGFPTAGSSEITALARAFERMRVSLDKALRLLGP